MFKTVLQVIAEVFVGLAVVGQLSVELEHLEEFKRIHVLEHEFGLVHRFVL
jgi:hypothetical protein